MNSRLLALPLALVAATANAEQSAMEEMIVTGSRTAERLTELPASVTIIDADAIDVQLQTSSDIQKLLAMQVPGMSPATGTSSNSGQTLRGRNALVLIDGVPQSTPLRNGLLDIRTVDPSNLARIEVVKGASSIYGNGAGGGIINYITRQPTADAALAGSASLSTQFSAVEPDGSLGYRAYTRVDGSQHGVSYLFSGSLEQTGLQYDAEGDIIGLVYGMSETRTENYFGKLGYAFSDDRRLGLTYGYYAGQQDADLMDVTGSVNTGEKTYAIKTDEPTPGVPQGPRGNTNVMLNYTDDALLPNTQMVLDAFGQTIENVFFFSTALANPDEGYEGGQSLIKSDKRGARANFVTNFDGETVATTLIYGIDALNDVSSQPLVDGRMWVPEMDLNSLAAYVQGKFLLGDQWVLKAGMREEAIDIAVDDYQTLRLCRTASACSVAMDVTGGELDYRATTYNLGVRYNLSDAFSPFANYSQGSDVPDLGRLLRTATVSDIAQIRTEASVVDHYEIGAAGQLDNWDYELAIYRSNSELGTSNVYDAATGVYMPVRAPQKIWGYEVAVNYSFSETLSAGANYAWVEGKNTATDTWLDGSQITAPKFVGQIRWAATDNFNLNLDYLWVGNRDRFEPGSAGYVGSQGPVKSYQVVNLSGSYRMGQLEARVGIENLFNEDYYSARSQMLTYAGYNTKSLGTTANVGVSYQF